MEKEIDMIKIKNKLVEKIQSFISLDSFRTSSLYSLWVQSILRLEEIINFDLEKYKCKNLKELKELRDLKFEVQKYKNGMNNNDPKIIMELKNIVCNGPNGFYGLILKWDEINRKIQDHEKEQTNV